MDLAKGDNAWWVDEHWLGSSHLSWDIVTLQPYIAGKLSPSNPFQIGGLLVEILATPSNPTHKLCKLLLLRWDH